MLSQEFILSKIVRIDLNEIPDYLSKTNPTFQTKFSSIVPNTNNLKQLRSIAVLMYKIICIELFSQLWKVYEQLCMGQLPTTLTLLVKQIDKKFIPKEILSLINHYRIQGTTNEEHRCLMLIHQCLCQLDEKSEEYRRELRSTTSSLPDYTPHIEKCLEDFVNKGVRCLRLEIDCQLALIHHYYMDELLHRQCVAQNLTHGQVNSFLQLFISILCSFL